MLASTLLHRARAPYLFSGVRPSSGAASSASSNALDFYRHASCFGRRCARGRAHSAKQIPGPLTGRLPRPQDNKSQRCPSIRPRKKLSFAFIISNYFADQEMNGRSVILVAEDNEDEPPAWKMNCP